jgi:hypothetical protein
LQKQHQFFYIKNIHWEKENSLQFAFDPSGELKMNVRNISMEVFVLIIALLALSAFANTTEDCVREAQIQDHKAKASQYMFYQ